MVYPDGAVKGEEEGGPFLPHPLLPQSSPPILPGNWMQTPGSRGLQRSLGSSLGPVFSLGPDTRGPCSYCPEILAPESA